MQYRNQITRRDTQRIQPRDQLLQGYAFRKHAQFVTIFGDFNLRPGNNDGLAVLRKGAGLTDERRFRYFDGQVALGNRNGADADILADNNDAGLLINNNFGR